MIHNQPDRCLFFSFSAVGAVFTAPVDLAATDSFITDWKDRCSGVS